MRRQLQGHNVNGCWIRGETETHSSMDRDSSCDPNVASQESGRLVILTCRVRLQADLISNAMRCNKPAHDSSIAWTAARAPPSVCVLGKVAVFESSSGAVIRL